MNAQVLIVTAMPELYGSGHLRRMRLVANQLVARGTKVVFFLKGHDGWHAIGAQGERVIVSTYGEDRQSDIMSLAGVFPNYFRPDGDFPSSIAMEFHSSYVRDIPNIRQSNQENCITMPFRDGKLHTPVCLLDLRDDDLPDFVHSRHLIAVDNCGAARSKYDIIWDVLPLVEHSLSEFQICLGRILIPPSITMHENRANEAQITLIDELGPNIPENALVLLTTDKRAPLSVTEFQQKLLGSETVYTYFGQTLFEAMYLGKRIFLYPVSEYHAQLNRALMKNLAHCAPVEKYFTGGGLSRLVEHIYERLT